MQHVSNYGTKCFYICNNKCSNAISICVDVYIFLCYASCFKIAKYTISYIRGKPHMLGGSSKQWCHSIYVHCVFRTCVMHCFLAIIPSFCVYNTHLHRELFTLCMYIRSQPSQRISVINVKDIVPYDLWTTWWRWDCCSNFMLVSLNWIMNAYKIP